MLSPMAIAGIVLICVFGGALVGVGLRAALPEHHLSADSKDIAKVAIALVATMAALVLSLLLSSAKSGYDTRNSELLQMSGDIVVLDRVLAHYGPETKDARVLLRNTVAAGIERFWPTDGGRTVGFDPAASPAEALYNKIAELSPQTEAHRSSQAQTLKIAMDLGHARFLASQQLGSSIPLPFLIMLIFWLTIIFLSLGIFAPRNTTVMAVFLGCALSVSGAIFLILELDQPFEGLIQISSVPLRQALAHLGQ